MSSTTAETSLPARCDVLVIGAGLAGVTSALLCQRRNPKARIVLLEASPTRETQSTSEPLCPSATQFYSRALRLDEILAREHLPNVGTHTWFTSDNHKRLDEMSVVGMEYSGSERAFHVDTARLANSIEKLAADEGVQTHRGARVTDLDVGWPVNRVRVQTALGESHIEARWLIDASGDETLIAKNLNLCKVLETPGNWSFSANWSGLQSIDGPALDPGTTCLRASREFATHYFQADDWNVRICPHVGGGASVELTLDLETYGREARGSTPLEIYSRWIRSRAGLRELLQQAKLDTDSFRCEKRLDQVIKSRAGRGWFLVGKAAGRLATPQMAPLERLASEAWFVADQVHGDLSGSRTESALIARLRDHNSVTRLADAGIAPELPGHALGFQGDAALFAAQFALERGLDRGLFGRRQQNQKQLVRGPRRVLFEYSLRGALANRLRQLAVSRQSQGILGQRNDQWTCDLRGSSGFRPLIAALRLWAQVEYCGLRMSMTPVKSDTHTPPILEIQSRARAALQSSRDQGGQIG
ncbi:MAG: 2-polyprenyl-6-methoxyphenol hydroxylase-like FAD-dependent oxidoreductase [Planctomycetota bacterium]|jgi:2-polyprenyl-6-methoxyphenol hydroxylase-like FAD-dependent oxidoreductase